MVTRESEGRGKGSGQWAAADDGLRVVTAPCCPLPAAFPPRCLLPCCLVLYKIIYLYFILLRTYIDGRWLALRRFVGAVVAVLSLLAGLPFQPVQASVYQASAEPVAPSWINPSSRPVAVIGINLSQNSGERLLEVGVSFTDTGGDGDFTTTDLLPLSKDASSGVALYLDNKSAGSFGTFDAADRPIALSAVPAWTAGNSSFRTLLRTGGTAIPANDLGNNTGPDLFVVVRTSSTASEGDDFSVSLGPDDVLVEGGPLDFPAADTDTITVDATSPRARAGPDITVDEGVETGFSAATSTDNIGIANYTWTFGDFGPDFRAWGVYVTHAFAAPGRFLVLLNVTDYAGNSDVAALTVTVRNVNQPPAITSTPVTAALQGSPYYYLLTATDPDHDTLRFLVLSAPPNMTVNPLNGLVSWVPGQGDVGGVSVTLGVTDDKSPVVRQSYTIEVRDVNDPPWFTSLPVYLATQGQSYSYRAGAQDPDNNQLVYGLVAGPANMTVGKFSGLVTWTPAWDQVGLNRVVLSASDGQYTVYQDFCVTVINTNDPPVIVSVPPTTALQGVPYGFRVQAFDPDGDVVRFFLNGSPPGMVLDEVSGVLDWTPSADQVGEVQVKLEATDRHGGQSNLSYTIIVVNVNDPPVITSAPPPTARQGSLYTYQVRVSDPDGDPVTLSLLSHPPGMSVNASSGVVEWVPGQESVGRAEASILASDGRGGIAVQSIQLAVQDTNDAPVFLGGIAPVAYQNQPYVSQVRAFDPDGDQLIYTLINPEEDISLDRQTGTLVWYPRVPQEAKIAVRVTDPNGTSADEVFTVTVRPSPVPPVVQSIGLLRARVGERFTYQIEASDPDGGRLRFSTPSRMLRINATTGVLSFTPRPADAGVHEFTVEVSDTGGMNTTATGVLVVDPEDGGFSLEGIFGFAMAGLAGIDPRLALTIIVALGAALAYQFARLRRLDELERPAGGEAPPGPAGVTEEERRALQLRQSRELEAREAAMRDAGTAGADAGMAAEERERLERKAREWDAALQKEREARELRERAREAGGPVLSREEQERLEREVEEELAAAGLGGTGIDVAGDAGKGAIQGETRKTAEDGTRRKVPPKRSKRRSRDRAGQRGGDNH